MEQVVHRTTAMQHQHVIGLEKCPATIGGLLQASQGCAAGFGQLLKGGHQCASSGLVPSISR
jgi:hypothetical protein